MRIGILGTGRMGQALAELLRGAGHDLVLGSRTPGEASFPTVTLGEALTHGEVVLIALPHAAIESNIALLSTIAPGTVVIDLANAVLVENGRIRSALEQPHGRWLADLLAHARVARAFTHIHDELLVSRAMRQPHTWAIAVAADDVEVLTIAETLVRDAGYVPVPIGDLNRSSVLDPGGPLFPNMYLPGDMRDLLRRHGA
ncbi:putative dinucleotide-binding enzyme [Microbacterium sp. SORGH_AS 1204]|uniref:NADPH-dependent F420 reductase n=1 Tax=Microbacterium sp. SORGH_AS_1204 TaxID=3041785 RepID=UPI00278E26FE|nr:NAD(P)-binding domain-containing protein [Microbacterium sp. SORGH_AS_1204]MDQ1135787.1 putative dinucleotide-binding enzyme [Microbacterium sp. SORGH_AS_1204]